MDTNRLKRFATEARNILMQGVAHRLSALGFLPDGSVTEEPQQQGGGATFMGDTVTQDFYDKWQSLRRAVSERGINEVAEEAAYTWFNRLVAIRILVKNGLASPVLEYESEDILVPLLVSEARQGRMPEMDADSLSKLTDLLDDDSKTSEQFALLIVAYCHENPIINKCFGRISDYTELLLPTNILTEGSFVYLLNHTQFISEEDYRSPELIGWLYQFYISERKDEVFAKKGKFEADEIPAATQIFTPNWIVKYMVQNTVGRIYLDNNPYEEDIQKNWQYLVGGDVTRVATNSNASSQGCGGSPHLLYDDLTDLRVADLACGSGHILNECFDLLYDLYIAEGYGRGKAIENIFRHNLTGIDLDTRAKQLAIFALLLKACQKDAAFADGHCLPRVLDMERLIPNNYSNLRDTLPHFFLGGSREAVSEILEAYRLMEESNTLGSIMKFNISDSTRALIVESMNRWQEEGYNDFEGLFPGMKLILALTEKYHALVMNPPYMGSGNMNPTLSKYVKDEYEDGKADLFSVFMLLANDLLLPNGKYGMINMQSWMFLSSFEKLRTRLLEENIIDNMLHLGPRTFDELSGEVVQNTAFVITNISGANTCSLPRKNLLPSEVAKKGTYYRLVDGKSCSEKEQLFLSHIYGNEDGKKIYYPNVSQQDFEKIPGCPIGYWVSSVIIESFDKVNSISVYADARLGMNTGSNDLFLRDWPEVSFNNICFSCGSNEESKSIENMKWYPYNKGGGTRKWFGLREKVVDWWKGGVNIHEYNNIPMTCNGAPVRAKSVQFFEGASWSFVSSGTFSIRYSPKGSMFDGGGPSLFSDILLYIIGFLNSKIANDFLKITNPTMNYQVGNISSLPLRVSKQQELENIVSENISISKQDWDAHETSWDFEENPLLAIGGAVSHCTTNSNSANSCCGGTPQLLLEDLMNAYKQKWEHHFMQLHANEEELNRQFIDIYGLQDELTPDVPLDEITILQQGEISIEEGKIKWHDDVVMKQFISYAVGCMMGRYRLDKKGLHIAHPNPSADEIAPYIYNNVEFEIDEDGIIPLMPGDCCFSDNASNRFADFVRIALDVEKHVENLNFVEKCLGKSVEQYFVKDFWKDHKKMYQNRPFYWLFSSKKGAFQCIAYMHRMNAYTAERIRTKYLLPHIEWLLQKQSEMEENAANLSTAERKKLDSIRKQIAECREYHDRLHVVADEQIAFDLDDGVVVNYAKFGDVLAKIK